MHNKWKEVDEEKPKYGSVYLNNVLNLNIQQTNSQTKANKQERIDYFGDGHIARLGSLNSKCIKQSFPSLRQSYLEMRRNYGKTE